MDAVVKKKIPIIALTGNQTLVEKPVSYAV
jgi:hypothetical protein